MPICGLVPAGRPVVTAWRQLSDTRFVTELPAPGAVAEVAAFLLPTPVLPGDRGLNFYFSLNGVEWTPLGVLTATRPSAIWRTGWPLNKEVAEAPVVQVGVSVEGVDAVVGLHEVTEKQPVL